MKKVKCADCGSTDVEIQLSAWFDPNTLKMVDVDECGDTVATWCNKCGDNTGLIAPNGQVIVGKYQ